MATSNVSGISGTSKTDSWVSGSLRTPVQTLGQEDFLKLLVTQMTQQDPMNPMKDTEFIAQMASFSSLEQSKTMMQDMAQLRATSLLGQTVTMEDDGSYTGQWSGVVDSIFVEDGVPKLMVEGHEFFLSDLISVERTTTPSLPLAESAKEATQPGPIQGEDSSA